MSFFKTTIQFCTAAVFFLFAFSACDPAGSLSVLPTSNGSFDEVLVVADRHQLGEVKELLKKSLAAPYEVLPQAEATFRVTYVAYEDFNHLFQHFRNVILVSDLSKTTGISALCTQALGEERLGRALNKEQDFYYLIQKDRWAAPQRIIYVFGADETQLKKTLAGGIPDVVNWLMEKELEVYERNNMLDGPNYDLTKMLAENHQLQLEIPKNYFLAKETEDFVWLRKETQEVSSNLMIYYLPDTEPLPEQAAIQWRNHLGKTYVSTEVDGAYMQSDTILPFRNRQLTIGDWQATETRGLWKMVNDFMGGPFVSYVIHDKTNHRYLMMDGFVYAPGTKKKPEIRKLEALIRSAQMK